MRYHADRNSANTSSVTLHRRKEIWNEVVEDGKAFPQMEKLDEVTGHAFSLEQTYTGASGRRAATGELVGLYILHPE